MFNIRGLLTQSEAEHTSVLVVPCIFGFSWFAEGTSGGGSLYLWVLMILNVVSAHQVSVKKHIMIIRQQWPLRIGFATNGS